jgi:hypothetical protein
MDYYKIIGYDYKKKKLNGLTIRQHIKKNLNDKKLDKLSKSSILICMR